MVARSSPKAPLLTKMLESPPFDEGLSRRQTLKLHAVSPVEKHFDLIPLEGQNEINILFLPLHRIKIVFKR